MVNETYARIPEDLRPDIERYKELQVLEEEPTRRFHKRLGLVAFSLLVVVAVATIVDVPWILLFLPLLVFLLIQKRCENELAPFQLEKSKIEKKFSDHELWLTTDPAGKVYIYPINFDPFQS